MKKKPKKIINGDYDYNAVEVGIKICIVHLQKGGFKAAANYLKELFLGEEKECTKN